MHRFTGQADRPTHTAQTLRVGVRRSGWERLIVSGWYGGGGGGQGVRLFGGWLAGLLVWKVCVCACVQSPFQSRSNERHRFPK